MLSIHTRNIIANYGSRLWGFISIYLFIPLYIHLLGIEAYGVIGFYSVILGVVSFVDAGISSAINREMAKSTDYAYKLNVLHKLERIYLSICFLIGAIIYVSAPYLANHWLTTEGISTSEMIGYLRLISVGVSLQLMSFIYFGGLMGLQKQVRANGIQVVWSVVRAAFAVLGLYFISRSLEFFFSWQIACNLLYLAALRYDLIKSIKSALGDQIAKPEKLASDIWKYLGGMLIISVLSAANIQIDKLVTSKLFSLENFSYYSLASTLAQVPLLLTTPIAIAIFPVMTKAISDNDYGTLNQIYKKYSFLVSVILMPVSVVLLFYGKDIFQLWLSNRSISNDQLDKINWVTKFLVMGNTFLALQFIPFYLLLSMGRTKFTIIQSIFQLLFIIPALYFFIGKYQFVGVSIPWLLMNFGGFVFLYFIVFSRFLQMNFVRFLISVIVVPLMVTLIIGGAILAMTYPLPKGVFTILYALIIGGVSVALNLFFYNRMNQSERIDIRKMLKPTTR